MFPTNNSHQTNSSMFRNCAGTSSATTSVCSMETIVESRSRRFQRSAHRRGRRLLQKKIVQASDREQHTFLGWGEFGGLRAHIAENLKFYVAMHTGRS